MLSLLALVLVTAFSLSTAASQLQPCARCVCIRVKPPAALPVRPRSVVRHGRHPRQVLVPAAPMPACKVEWSAQRVTAQDTAARTPSTKRWEAAQQAGVIGTCASCTSRNACRACGQPPSRRLLQANFCIAPGWKCAMPQFSNPIRSAITQILCRSPAIELVFLQRPPAHAPHLPQMPT